MAVKPIPDWSQGVAPYPTVRGAEALLEFVTKAFDSEETIRVPMDDEQGASRKA